MVDRTALFMEKSVKKIYILLFTFIVYVHGLIYTVIKKIKGSFISLDIVKLHQVQFD